jgi:Ca-activated chloride channel family protein
MVIVLILAACESAGGSGGGGGGANVQPGYEIYTHNGGVARPSNAIDVYIVYSPETEQYMPELIRRFNQAYAEGQNPVSGQNLASGEQPIYVWGTDPVTGSSGTVAQGIVNAIIAPNNANVYKPTIFQPSVSHWLGWSNVNSGRPLFNLTEASATALSPVIIGIWEDRLNQLLALTGKSREEIGWADLLNVLENGWEEGRRAVYYGHTDPRISSTGLSNTIIEFYACARQNGFTGRRLTVDEVNRPEVQECMRRIQNLVRHYSRRTEDFLEYFGQGPDYLDMLALEETDLICINLGAQQGAEQCLQPQGGKLMALYPSEGTFWHEHPFGIVQYDVEQGGWTTAAQRAGARVFTDFVLTPESQQHIMQSGFRPANPNVPVEYPFVEENGVLPAGPPTILDVPDTSVINAIQQSWTLVKKQADVMIVIDISGSMNDSGKIDAAREAALQFLEGMESGNRVGLTVFSDNVDVRVPLGQLETVENQVSSHIKSLRAGGGTELFQALTESVALMSEVDAENRVRAVVILSDGADTGDSGATLNGAINAISASRDSLNPVIVVPLAYGADADALTLNSIAQASRTRLQSGDVENISGLLDLLSSFF